jgi:hypothetical protein
VWIYISYFVILIDRLNDLGFFNLPEVNIGLPLSDFKWIAMARLSEKAMRTAALTGMRFNAKGIQY